MFLLEHRSSRPLLGHSFEPSPPPPSRRRRRGKRRSRGPSPDDDDNGRSVNASGSSGHGEHLGTRSMVYPPAPRVPCIALRDVHPVWTLQPSIRRPWQEFNPGASITSTNTGSWVSTPSGCDTGASTKKRPGDQANPLALTAAQKAAAERQRR